MEMRRRKLRQRKILEFATYAQEVAVGPKFSYKPDKKTTIYIYLKPGVDPAPRSWGHAGANPNEAEMYFLSPSEAIKVLEMWRNHPGDIIDCYIAANMEKSGEKEIVSYDKKIAMLGLQRIEP